ncbi:4-(cytidine 5'-diphospho)-2-C-methyl-D-erythritol kinase [Marispirochaeta aestuarii]|uniref:4-(cytidine 5'-diphospho)-2-C-methyl-D-erythritol kinase n=1 Tax=Marispirochaeta aestuarii TaxID=1963862 RepID=UPI0029C7A501|nr:4-(cytidine 5'-diphospho)-2-C-methyl-D-erythritol kinase [Marispirochaeta aestuarii]
MMRAITLQSPAKVNLHLEIGGRRNDGFHDLCSLFQIVSLADTITVRSLKDSNNTCSIHGRFSCVSEDNLICRAYRLFSERYGLKTSVEVTVEKRIPEGAGLGGGSSNAATMLKSLRDLFSVPVDNAELARISAELGSDVPFFCRSPLALVTGRGDKVLPLNKPRTLPLVLVLPDFPVSTADAYRWLDEKRGGDYPMLSAGSDYASLYERTPDKWTFFNSFTPVLRERYPLIGQLIDTLLSSQALYADVSGSGSAIFGVFTDEAAARRAALVLKGKKNLKQVLTIETLAIFPDSILQ